MTRISNQATIDRNLLRAARALRRHIAGVNARDPGIGIPGWVHEITYFASIRDERIELLVVNRGRPRQAPYSGYRRLSLRTMDFAEPELRLVPATKMAPIIARACEAVGLRAAGWWPGVDVFRFA